MLPFMAQGAAQSIEDGATLAACLLQGDAADVASALRRYEALRRPRAARLQEMSRGQQDAFPPPRRSRAAGARRGDGHRGDRSIAAIGWLYGHDASVINGDPESELP